MQKVLLSACKLNQSLQSGASLEFFDASLMRWRDGEFDGMTQIFFDLRFAHCGGNDIFFDDLLQICYSFIARGI